MAAYSDINGFPESGFPVLSDVSDRVCLNTLYWNPLKEAGFILDIVGNNRLAGNLSLAGMLSGVTSITMNGALSGVSTITANGTATLTSSNPLSLTDVNANIRMPGLNSSIGSILERVNKGYFKNIDVANTLTVNGDDVALIGDIKRYVSGTLNTLPKYNATGITDSTISDDGRLVTVNSVVSIGRNDEMWGLPGVDADATLYLNFRGYQEGLTRFRSTHILNGKGATVGFFDGINSRVGVKTSSPAYTLDVNGDTRLGTNNGYLKGTSGVVGAVSSIPESDITPTAYSTLTVTSNATTWDCSTGLNKRVTISANLTLTITNLVDGMSGDLVVNVSSISSITITTTGFTQKKYGSLASKPIGKYHLCWICEGTNIDFNITDTPYA